MKGFRDTHPSQYHVVVLHCLFVFCLGMKTEVTWITVMEAHVKDQLKSNLQKIVAIYYKPFCKHKLRPNNLPLLV